MNFNNNYRGRGRGAPFSHTKNFRTPHPNIFNNHINRRNSSNNCMPLLHLPNYRETTPRWQRPQQNLYSWRVPSIQHRLPHTSNFRPRMPPPLMSTTPVISRPLRPLSPLPGSEEARQKAIAAASARIKEQLNLDEGDIDRRKIETPPIRTKPDTPEYIDVPEKPCPSYKLPEKITRRKVRRSTNSMQSDSTNIHELRKKILTQFTYMSKGKIQNLVNNPGSSRYDVALQHIIRDMRLNLSAELRNMYNNREADNSKESNEMIDRFNSIVPDLGVELVSLPDAMIEELSKILQLDANDSLEDVPANNECVLVEPEELFKQAQQMLSNSNYLEDIVDKSEEDDPLPDDYNIFDECEKDEFLPENVEIFDGEQSQLNNNQNNETGFSSTSVLNNSDLVDPFYQNDVQNLDENESAGFSSPTNFNFSQFSNFQQFPNSNKINDTPNDYDFTKDTFFNNLPPEIGNNFSESIANTQEVAENKNLLDLQQNVNNDNSFSFCNQVENNANSLQPDNEIRHRDNLNRLTVSDVWVNPPSILLTNSANCSRNVEQESPSAVPSANATNETQNIYLSPSSNISTCSNENRMKYACNLPRIEIYRTSNTVNNTPVLESTNASQSEQKYDFNSMWLGNMAPTIQKNVNLSPINNLNTELSINSEGNDKNSFELGIAWLDSINKNISNESCVEPEKNLATTSDTHESVFKTTSNNILTIKPKAIITEKGSKESIACVDNINDCGSSMDKKVYSKEKAKGNSMTSNEVNEQNTHDKVTNIYPQEKCKQERSNDDKVTISSSEHKEIDNTHAAPTEQNIENSKLRIQTESPKHKRLPLDERIKILQQTHAAFRTVDDTRPNSKRLSRKKQKRYEKKLAYLKKRKMKELLKKSHSKSKHRERQRIEIENNIIKNVNTIRSQKSISSYSKVTSDILEDLNAYSQEDFLQESSVGNESLTENPNNSHTAEKLLVSNNELGASPNTTNKNIESDVINKKNNSEVSLKFIIKEKECVDVPALDEEKGNKNVVEKLIITIKNSFKAEIDQPRTTVKDTCNTPEDTKPVLKIKIPRELNEVQSTENETETNTDLKHTDKTEACEESEQKKIKISSTDIITKTEEYNYILKSENSVETDVNEINKTETTNLTFNDDNKSKLAINIIRIKEEPDFIVEKDDNSLSVNNSCSTNVAPSDAPESQPVVNNLSNKTTSVPAESCNTESNLVIEHENTVSNSRESEIIPETIKTDTDSIEINPNIKNKTLNKTDLSETVIENSKEHLNKPNNSTLKEKLDQKTSTENKKENKPKSRKEKPCPKSSVNEVENKIQDPQPESHSSKSNDSIQDHSVKHPPKIINDTKNNTSSDLNKADEMKKKRNTNKEKESKNTVENTNNNKTDKNLSKQDVEKSESGNKNDINKQKTASADEKNHSKNDISNISKTTKDLSNIKKHPKRKHEDSGKNETENRKSVPREEKVEHNKKPKYKQDKSESVKTSSETKLVSKNKKININIDNTEKIKDKAHSSKRSHDIPEKNSDSQKSKNSTEELKNQNKCVSSTKSEEKNKDKIKQERKHSEITKNCEEKRHVSKESKEVQTTFIDNQNDLTIHDKNNKENIKTEDTSTQTHSTSQEDILKRLMNIDLEIQKLMQEKFQLYKELQISPAQIHETNIETNNTITPESIPPLQNSRKRKVSVTISESSAIESVPEIINNDIHQLSDSNSENFLGKKRKREKKITVKRLKKSIIQPAINLQDQSKPPKENVAEEKNKKSDKKLQEKIKNLIAPASGSDSESNISLRRLRRRSKSTEKVIQPKEQTPDKRLISRRSTSLEKTSKDNEQTPAVEKVSDEVTRITRRSISVEKVNEENRSSVERTPIILTISTKFSEASKTRTKKRKKSNRSDLIELLINTETTLPDNSQSSSPSLYQNVKPCYVHLERVNVNTCSPKVNIDVTENNNEIAIKSEVCDTNTTSDVCVENPVASENVEMEASETYKPDLMEACETNKSDLMEVCEEEKQVTSSDVAQTIKYNDIPEGGLFCVGHQKSILDIKLIGDEFLAASEDGTIYKYCLDSGSLQDAYTGHKKAVTSMYITDGAVLDINSILLYSGSLDSTLKCWNIDTAEILDEVTVGQPIQCLDSAWGYIFLGTYNGFLFIYDIKKKHLNDVSLTIASATVLMLKATQEGSRQVLIIASRKREIMVRDAFTGLLLRTMCQEQKPTIYSLFLDRSMVYCGTSDKGILVIDFNNGQQVGLYTAGKGVVCMLMHGPLLFAGCYDGMIYVYNTRTQKEVSVITGPGDGMLLSLAITDSLIIAGTKKEHLLKIWKIPQEVLREMI